MDRRFSGKVAIVTGGASGIGEATARRFAEEGAAVVVADLNGEGASRVAAAIASAGGRAVAQTCDVSREDEIVACVERAVEEFGGLDIMHNNAADTSHATMAGDALAADSDAEYFEHVFRVNVIGVMLGCKHAIPRLLERGGGAIINTSSGAALASRPQGGTAYAASKAAVESITRSVAVQYGKQGIRCNGIAPGITVTDHARASLGDEMLDVMRWAAEAPALATARAAGGGRRLPRIRRRLLPQRPHAPDRRRRAGDHDHQRACPLRTRTRSPRPHRLRASQPGRRAGDGLLGVGSGRYEMGNLDDAFRRSLDDPNGFWAEAASALEWDRPWERVLDDSDAPHYRWFSGGAFNTCRNAVDRHVEAGRADQLALIYDSPVSGARATLTYRELRDAVATFAGALVRLGVERGDRVVIYMPMVPEAVIAMLACARIGAVHSVVFGGFASMELAARIDDAQPKVVVSASCGIEPSRLVPYKPLLDAAIESVRVKPRALRDSPAADAHRGARCCATSTGTMRWPARIPSAVYRSRRPTRCTSSTPPAPRVSRRASSATTAAMQLPSRGRCATSSTPPRESATGPPPTSAGSSATRTSSTGRCSRAARPSSTKGSRWGRPTRVRSGGWSRSTAFRRSSRRRRHFAQSDSTIPRLG